MSVLQAPALWFVALMVAVLWPSRFIGPLDGAPLDRPLEAIVLGLGLPWLFWLGRTATLSRTFRWSVLVLLAWKVLTPAVAAQQGLCANVRAPQPLNGIAFAMRIEEPHGALRSWDVRADLWDDDPACTAIITRPLMTTTEFPAWFVNITDQMLRNRALTMRISGFATTASGTTPVEAAIALDKEPWQFNPQIAGGHSLDDALLTVREPSSIDRALSPWAWAVSPLLCFALLWSIGREAVRPVLQDSRLLSWVLFGSAVGIALASSPITALHRAVGLLAFGALVVNVHAARARIEHAAWMIGAPWLAFFAALSIASIGRFSAYSMDDWLAYQVAGYRIYMNGHWIEAGTTAFDYQALYRWITGGLHLVFGDSSVGELYLDASFFLIGALLAAEIVRQQAGFRWSIGAAALTLATLTIATPWHMIGRGLSEISAAGFAFVAVAALMRAQHAGLGWSLLGGLAAALMFYGRINHLLWAPCLVVMLLPLAVGSDWGSVRAALSRYHWKAAMLYLGVFAAAVVAFMARTNYFTGRWALFHGTSLRHNDTGLRPWTLFDAEPWTKVGHSLMGLLFMNEPPRPDPRSVVLIIAIAVVLLALIQRPIARRIPASLVLVTITGAAGALIAHSHAYPGRFTIHLVPFASALTTIAASAMFSRSGGAIADSAEASTSGDRVA
jgi:hypothetical protein